MGRTSSLEFWSSEEGDVHKCAPLTHSTVAGSDRGVSTSDLLLQLKDFGARTC